jgi:predicted nucleotidyltransferase
MEQPSLETIRQSIRREWSRLQADYGVVAIWVVGSRAKGNARPDSDLDMLVELDGRPMGLLRFVDLETELTQISNLPVDLGQKEALRKEIRDEVLSSAVLV